MLDATTKRNIDAARDVLVGKVPDPKAQVEQITTALIYKFMDDLDKESLRLGGKAKFFSGEYEKYSWSNLVDTRLSGEARLGLYVQAITSMDKNPSLPQLFRDIFKGAFLPYNDPQTLSLFLKEINKFTYNHSEELGNAFEYLLSIMSSQGAAGQFRTPRHIIDFMVAVVDPQKNETILDPACGTAGFLISSFKHIRKHNSSNFDENNGIGGGLAETADQTFLQDDPHYRGDLLTQDERRRLMENIQGYDISPDMVRLSLVNLYLHGFPAPNIFEYDTLSSEDRWNDTFDVILANPPFMTPKGGIRPHKRFQVQASRSEVLFVDYILEHLNVNGRAGIIVPEGIVFKSENAYKQLRKLLVEDGLYAVVSLPSGVFNPYSGVKTSILFFDHQFAKQVDEILFINIEHDGFDLGAQRKRIEENDLEEALLLIREWKCEKRKDSEIALFVNKDEIKKDGFFFLIGERYKKIDIQRNQKWQMIQLGDLVEIKNGLWKGKKEPFINVKIIRNTNFTRDGQLNLEDVAEHLVEEKHFVDRRLINGDIILENSGGGPTQPVGRVAYFDLDDRELYSFSNFTSRLRINTEKMDSRFLFFVLRDLYNKGVTERMQKRTSGIRNLDKKAYQEIRIPVPPIKVQKEIVEQIEVKQAAIDAAKAVIENLEKNRRFFGHEIVRTEDVEWVTLDEVCEINPESDDPVSKYKNGFFTYIDISSVDNTTKNVNLENKIKVEDAPSRARRIVQDGDIIISTVRPNLRGFALLNNLPERTITSTGFAVLRIKPSIDPYYLYNVIYSDQVVDQMIAKMGKGSYPSINQTDVKQIKIPLLDLSVQKHLASIIKKENEIIEANRELIDLLEEKIKIILEEI